MARSPSIPDAPPRLISSLFPMASVLSYCRTKARLGHASPFDVALVSERSKFTLVKPVTSTAFFYQTAVVPPPCNKEIIVSPVSVMDTVWVEVPDT